MTQIVEEKKKKVSKKMKDCMDLILIFKYPEVDVDISPDVDEDVQDQIQNAIDLASEEIIIDPTYVDYRGTKYQKTFIYEDGWIALNRALRMSSDGKSLTKIENEGIREGYSQLIVAYLYQFLEDLGYDIGEISLSLDPKSPFIVEVRRQKIIDNYPGKWQTW